jgi:hypothetical protein
LHNHAAYHKRQQFTVLSKWLLALQLAYSKLD